MTIDIVLICALGRGGLEKVITMVSRELIKRGNRVRVIQVFKPKYEEWQKELDEFYTLTDFQFSNDVSIEEMSEMYADFMRENGKPGVVFATHVPFSTYLWRQSLEIIDAYKEVPLISWVHGPLMAYGKNYDHLLSFADAHLAISKEIENQLLDLSEKASVYLVRNPIEFKENVVSRNGEILKLLYVGRLEKEKRLDVLLDSIKDLEGRWHLDIVGDGSERKKVEDEIEKYNLSKNIKMYGWLDNPWDSIKEANILLVTSEQEGFGLVMAEALSLGMPVLSTRTEGAVDMIEEGVNGWMVEVDDVLEIKDILTDIQKGEILLPSKDACIKSAEKFNVENVVNRIERSMKIEMNKKRTFSKKKIIDIVLNYLSGKGGTEEVLKMTINYLLDNGYRVRIIQFYKSKSDEWLKECNVEVYTLFSHKIVEIPNEVLYVKEYDKVMKRFGRPDIMLATGIPYMSFVCSEVRRELNLDNKILSWIHNPLNVFESYEKIRYADAHLAISREVLEQINIVDPDKRAELVYNPVCVKNKKKYRRGQELNLLYIGRLNNRQKNISMLLNSLSRVKGRWNLKVYGDGEDYRWLRGLSKTLEINESITWKKWVEDPWGDVEEVSVLVVTSKFEGFGLVIVEALARGIPVITTPCGIAKEIVVDGYNGWIIKNNTELTELLNKMVNKKVVLPSCERCQESVEEFMDKKVLAKIKNSIKRWIK